MLCVLWLCAGSFSSLKHTQILLYFVEKPDFVWNAFFFVVGKATQSKLVQSSPDINLTNYTKQKAWIPLDAKCMVLSPEGDLVQKATFAFFLPRPVFYWKPYAFPMRKVLCALVVYWRFQ